MPGSLGHLAARFFDYLTAGELSAAEERLVRDWLSSKEIDLFFAQSKRDRAHGFHAAMFVAEADHPSPELVQAALLHDVGKRHSDLGVVGRVVASLLIKAGLPLTERMARYRDHGLLGARDLEHSGSSRLAIDFARHHHGQRPGTIDLETWDLLQRADIPAKPRLGGGRE